MFMRFCGDFVRPLYKKTLKFYRKTSEKEMFENIWKILQKIGTDNFKPNQIWILHRKCIHNSRKIHRNKKDEDLN